MSADTSLIPVQSFNRTAMIGRISDQGRSRAERDSKETQQACVAEDFQLGLLGASPIRAYKYPLLDHLYMWRILESSILIVVVFLNL